MPVELKGPGNVNFFSYFCINAISQRKRTKRNRPRPGALRAALRFSQPAGLVEIAYAQTATGPFSPAAAIFGPGRWDILIAGFDKRLRQGCGLRKAPYLRGSVVSFSEGQFLRCAAATSRFKRLGFGVFIESV